MLLAGEKLEVFGRALVIDPYVFPQLDLSLSVDVETDEKDNFVGMAIYDGGQNVYYWSTWNPLFETVFIGRKIIAHNAKFDVRLLKKWGAHVISDNIYFDTMLASYSIDCGGETHALKPLALKHLNYKWKTYDEMTKQVTTKEHWQKFTMTKGEDGKRHKVALLEPVKVTTSKTIKQTLDTKPVDEVAHYCACDTVATWDLMKYLDRRMTPEAKWIFYHLEMPVLRIVFDMEHRGIRMDTHRLKELHGIFSGEMESIKLAIDGMIGQPININSSKQLAPQLERVMGIRLPVTEKGNSKTSKDVLQLYAGHPLADRLIEYSQVKKLVTAFTVPLAERGERCYPTYNQVVREQPNNENDWLGISTGRLSCSNPNLQQIPKRSKRGKLLRELFVPEEGEALVCADFSQIEPRILAHMSRDPYLIDVYRTDKDVYTSIVAGTSVAGREDARDYGKIGYLALTYMAQPKKLAKAWKCSLAEAEQIYAGMWKNLPVVRKWQNACIAYGSQLGGVKTLFKRFRSLPGLKSYEWSERASAERKAVNTPIQGSAADIMKLAMIKLTEAGYEIRLVVHDEVLVSVPAGSAERDCARIRDIMEHVTELMVPIKVDAHVGPNWGAAKG